MRDPLSSRPFADSDVPRILAAARATRVRHRDGTYDPELAARIVSLMLTFGPHVSVLSGGTRWRKGEPIRYDEPLSSADLRTEGGQLYLAWRRPKTGNPVMIPVPDDMAPWLPGFLDKPRWTRRSTYNEMLKRVETTLRYSGSGILLTPSRFRHTAAVRLRKMGLLTEDIEDMLAISPQTMRHYINRTSEERTRDLKSRGWDHSTLS